MRKINALTSIFRVLTIIIKWGAVLGVFMRTIQFFMDELKADTNASKLLGMDEAETKPNAS